MNHPLRPALAWARTPTGAKAVRYSAVSVICLVITQAVLLLTFGILRLASAVECNVMATAVATVPSYTLNRRWAWGKEGRSHLWRELVPFWTLAAASFLFSLYAVGLADRLAMRSNLSHFWESVLVLGANLAAYGILWVGKFLLFNRLLFVDRANAGTGDGGSDAGGDLTGPPAPTLTAPPAPATRTREQGRLRSRPGSAGPAGQGSAARPGDPAGAGTGEALAPGDASLTSQSA